MNNVNIILMNTLICGGIERTYYMSESVRYDNFREQDTHGISICLCADVLDTRKQLPLGECGVYIVFKNITKESVSSQDFGMQVGCLASSLIVPYNIIQRQ